MAAHARSLFTALLVPAVALVLGAACSSARAQTDDDDDLIMAPRLHLRGLLTFGGRAELEVNGDTADDDLVVGFGGAVELESPVHRYVTLGVGVSLNAWQADIEDDDAARNLLFDLDVVPRFRIPMGDDGMHGQVHVGVPVGLGVNLPSDDYADGIDALGGDLSTGFGLHVGGRVGAEWFFSPRFGPVGELGVDFHALSHTLDAFGGDERFTLRLTNFSAQAGFVLAL